jgi:hypothetical protein
MGWLDDTLDFEIFHTKDLWKRLKDDPKRLFLGVDPWSTKAWNAVLGRDDEPLVDQMGGAYGGSTFSWGPQNQTGGVYERARAAGIDTRAGAGAQDLAHTIAAYYALTGAGNAFGGFGGEGNAQPGLWEQGFSGKTSFSTGLPSSGTSATAGIPGIAGPVGGGTGASSAAGMSAMDWGKLGMNASGASGSFGGQSRSRAQQLEEAQDLLEMILIAQGQMPQTWGQYG